MIMESESYKLSLGSWLLNDLKATFGKDTRNRSILDTPRSYKQGLERESKITLNGWAGLGWAGLILICAYLATWQHVEVQQVADE